MHALELNLSCPNVEEGLQYCESTAAIEGLVSKIRAVTKLPIWVKLSPNVSDNVPLAKAAEAAGADIEYIKNHPPSSQ